MNRIVKTMKTKHLLVSIVIAVSCGIVVFSSFKAGEEALYQPRTDSEGMPRGIKGALQWRYNLLANNKTGRVDFKDVQKAWNQVAESKKNKADKALADLEWIEMGPDNIGGRCRALLIDKSDNNLMYAGGVSGGLWMSVNGGASWEFVTTGDFPNLAVACISQSVNGDIYFGTGEGHANIGGAPFNTGTYGQGIWKKSSSGSTFSRLEATWNSGTGTDEIFNVVNEVACDPTDNSRVYAATGKGLYVSSDGGSTWEKAITENVFQCQDVAVGSDGTVITAIYKYSGTGWKLAVYKSSTGDVGSFTAITSDSDEEGKLSSASAGRYEFAFSPQDPNYIYAACSKNTGALKAIYQSKDKGATWQIIGNRSNQFTPFAHDVTDSGQGTYDNVIAVHPTNKEVCFLGGVYSIWRYENENWEPMLSSITGSIHADQHAIVFHPDFANNKTVFFGTDGGIYKYNFTTHIAQKMNKFFNVTQFYSVTCSNNDEVMGGTQDNGTLYINKKGNTVQNAIEFSGGDGAYCAISMLNPEAAYSSVYYGHVYRTDKGVSGGAIDIGFDIADASFVTPIRLWESFNDPYTVDTVLFINDTIFDLDNNDTIVNIYYQGDLVFAESKIADRPIPFYVEEDSIVPGDTVRVKDIYQAMLVFGGYQEIRMSREALDFSDNPRFEDVKLGAGLPTNHVLGFVNTLEISKNGDYVYAAVDRRVDSVIMGTHYNFYYSDLYRLSKVAEARKYPYTKYTYFHDSTMVVTTDSNSIVSIDTLGILDSTFVNFVTDTTGYAYDTLIVTNLANYSVDTVLSYDTIHTVPDTLVHYTIVSVEPIIENVAVFSYEYDIQITYNLDTTYTIKDTVLVNQTNYNSFDSILVKRIGTWDQDIAGIAINPNNPEEVIVTLGNYGEAKHVLYSSNAATTSSSSTATNFVDKTGDLPEMPVYCAMFEKDDPKIVLIGTELGVWGTENIQASSVQWSSLDVNGLGNVPVYQIKQQYFPNGFVGVVNTGIKNAGFVYIGTHGRGIWKTEYFADPVSTPEIEFAEGNSKGIRSVKIYPNPVIDNATVAYTVGSKSNVTITVYDLFGKKVAEEKISGQPQGAHKYQMNASGLSKGTYFVSVQSGNERKSAKFIKY